MLMPRPKYKENSQMFNWNKISKDIINDKNNTTSVTGLYPRPKQICSELDNEMHKSIIWI
jgi:hypothetical protein